MVTLPPGLVVSATDLLQAVTDSPVALCVLDPSGLTMFGNPAYAELLGRAGDELAGLTAADVFHPEDRPIAEACLERLLAHPGERVQREYRLVRPDGAIVHALTSTTLTRDDHGAPRFVVFQAIDLSGRRSAEQELARRLDQQSTAAAFGRRALSGDLTLDELCAEAAGLVARTLQVEHVAILELDAAHTSCVVRWSIPADGGGARYDLAGTLLERMLRTGAPVIVDVAADRSRTLVDHGLHSALCVPVGSMAEPFGGLGAYSATPRVFHEDEHHFLTAVANILGHAVRRDQHERELRHLALHDAATGLPNRPLLDDRLSQALAASRRDGRYVAILFVDLDDFKAVNDSLGHQAGDDVLRAVGQRLRGALRETDAVARIGGDEFVVVAGGLPVQQDAVRLAEHVLATLAPPVVTRGVEHVVRASIGVRVADPVRDASTSPEELLRDADSAMYSAKHRGRHRFECFDEAVPGLAVDRLRTEQELRQAISADELRLVFQPFARLRDGSWFGAETLLRWDHPRRGLLAPDAFLEVAERSGLIVPIGEWVLREACRNGARWRASWGDDLLITVNVSPRQLADADVVAAVRRALDDSGLAPVHLGLELTEQALIDVDTDADRVLHALKALGVRLLLDDFGTGFSSLSHLKRFPIDGIKIDRSFIGAVTRPEADDTAIVRAILAMAWATGKFVIPEGIETAAQAKTLRRFGCRLGQGYLFARPVPAEEIDHACVTSGGHDDPAAIATLPDPSRFADAASRLLAALRTEMAYGALGIGHLDDELGVLRVIVTSADSVFGLAPGHEVPIGESLCQLLASGAGPPLTGDVAHSPYGALAVQRQLGFGSFVGQPLEVHGVTIGALCAIAREPDAFSASDLDLLGLAARMIARELEDTVPGPDDIHQHLRRVPLARARRADGG
jgi:diguanylate cyclase (GGDEF)-like protein/PAS domain S-box-containing protein